ncbi:MAG TPA: hypothetical protein VEJ63_14500 [Planctomycetota bacterium]|nr:hypothetical protein [Planctomycetota bacterium]
MSDSNAKSFWQNFQSSSADYARRLLGGEVRETFSDVDALLQAHGYDISFELTVDNGVAVLILSPEGDVEEAKRIDALAGLAPKLRHWKVLSRKPRKNLSDAFVFIDHIYGVDCRDATFILTRTVSNKDRIVMRTAAVEGFTDAEANGLAKTFLFHALGEDMVMERFSEVIAAAPDSSATGEKGFSASELVATIK